jgi:dCMP deaminase
MLTKWDARHLSVAHTIAQWSKDPSTKVGARISDGKNRIVSEGFNGPPRGVEDDPTISRESKLRRTIHAERNAILFAQRDLTGCTLYVTHHPCAQCAALIVQAGITRVVCNAPDPAFQTRWAEDIAEAKFIFTGKVELLSLET